MIVDVSKPLCRGRKISWDTECEGWAAFMYERLPNICYWCGSVFHDDKDCSLSLHSKGTLKLDDQQFGPWIRAPLFNPAKKCVVEVRGYDVLNKGDEDLMILPETRVDCDVPGLYQGCNNVTSTSQFQIDVVNNNKGTRAVVGNLATTKDVSSSVRRSSMLLQDGKAIAGDFPNFEEQLHA